MRTATEKTNDLCQTIRETNYAGESVYCLIHHFNDEHSNMVELGENSGTLEIVDTGTKESMVNMKTAYNDEIQANMQIVKMNIQG